MEISKAHVIVACIVLVVVTKNTQAADTPTLPVWESTYGLAAQHTGGIPSLRAHVGIGHHFGPHALDARLNIQVVLAALSIDADMGYIFHLHGASVWPFVRVAPAMRMETIGARALRLRLGGLVGAGVKVPIHPLLWLRMDVEAKSFGGYPVLLPEVQMLFGMMKMWE